MIRLCLAALLLPATALSQHSEMVAWTPSGLEFQAYFGSAVALQGSLALIGGRNAGVGGAGFLYDLDSLEPRLIQRLPSGGDLLGHMGEAVALDGKFALIGDTYDTTPGGYSAGSVHVYELQGDAWQQQDRIFPLDGDPFSRFGQACGIDGDHILVCAPFMSSAHGQRGAVFAYERRSTGWVHTQTIYADPKSRFYSVVLQGDLALIGGHRGGYPNGSGVVDVYERGPAGWTRSDTLAPLSRSQYFGAAVAIDGLRVVVGEPRLGEPGHVHVYRRTNSGWVSEGDLTGRKVQIEDGLGTAVKLRGEVLIAGAPQRRIENKLIGAIDVWRWKDGEWRQQAELIPRALIENPHTSWFGAHIAIDDHRILAGNEHAFAGALAGVAYLFHEPLGWPGCRGVPTVLNKQAILVAQGSPEVADRRLRLEAIGLLLGREVVFLASRGTDTVPGYQGGEGTLCLAEPLLRLGTGTADIQGLVHLDVNPVQLPFGSGHISIQPGETWWFQAFFEDIPSTNLSRSLSITFE